MRVLKILLIIVGVIIGLLLATFLYFKVTMNQAEPQGVVSTEADLLAEKMMASVDKVAWDSTRFVKWTFNGSGKHNFIWDKRNHDVQVSWDENRVILNTKDHTKGSKAFVNGKEISGDAATKAVNSAWSYFCNDSFWLNPVVKATDPGTERSIVKTEDDKEALKVQYKSGGVTPGDAYLWTLDENYRPTSWQMWTQILPIDGFPIAWKGWKQLSTGAWISTTHDILGSDSEMIVDVKAGMTLQDLGVEGNPFE